MLPQIHLVQDDEGHIVLHLHVHRVIDGNVILSLFKDVCYEELVKRESQQFDCSIFVTKSYLIRNHTEKYLIAIFHTVFPRQIGICQSISCAITFLKSSDIITVFSPAWSNASMNHLLHCFRSSFVQSASVILDSTSDSCLMMSS